MTLEEQLRALIDSAPPHVQRHFACDCLERALRPARVQDERYWRAIEIARRYAEGRATMDELNAARSARLSAARFSAWSASWYSAIDAAWDAARFLVTDEEREWQFAHLQHLLAAHNAARSSLLTVLSERAARMQVSPSFAQTLEEALFT